MQAVVTSAASVGFDAVLPGASGPVVALVGLVKELYSTREMAEHLVKSVADLDKQLAKMLANGRHNVTKNALEQYHELVEDIQSCLNEHIAKHPVARGLSHWTMKNRINEFHVERVRIEAFLGLEFREESGEHHAQTRRMVEKVLQATKDTEEKHQEGLHKVIEMIDSMPKAMTVSLLEDPEVRAALVDLNNERLQHTAEYSSAELEVMRNLVYAGCETFKIPRKTLDVPLWYISREHVKFDVSNPFASGQFHNLHHGTLDTGARVAISIAKVDLEDQPNRERFIREVTTLSFLRNPHVLPFFGANHNNSPLMYVSALAPNGNFRSFLKIHPHQFYQLFLDAARGLLYLHSNKLVHGNLKCSNLLVMADGTGVISDFMFAFVRTNSVLSAKAKPTKSNWTAPECLSEHDSNPRFKSDTYSLGLCMIEALTDKDPYEGIAHDDAQMRAMIRNHQLPSWSSRDGIPPSVERLVLEMCAPDYNNRPDLREVIRILEALVAQERLEREKSVCVCLAPTTCRTCDKPRRVTHKPHPTVGVAVFVVVVAMTLAVAL